VAIATLSTGLPVPLLGSISIAATLLDPAASSVTMQWDISQHLDGNTVPMHAQCDVSQDGGVTWDFLCSAERDKGYSGGSLAFITHPLPGVGNALRMIRATLVAASAITPVTTSMQLVVS